MHQTNLHAFVVQYICALYHHNDSTIVVQTVIVKLGLVWQSASGGDRPLSTNAPTRRSRGHAPQEMSVSVNNLREYVDDLE